MINNEFEQLVMESEFRSKDDEITERAREAFGISYLFPWQRLVIANILDAVESAKASASEDASANGESGSASAGERDDRETLGHQIVLLPTGAGKSLCFQVPSLFLDGPTLVIYPLLALMSDQQRRIDSGGLGSVIFRGGQTSEEREKNFARLKDGSAKFIIANPEVLHDEKLVARLAACKIAHIAIDEAHCVSEWGDSFRPAYLELGKILKKLAVPVVTAFTATASPPILQRVAEILFDGEAHIVRSESDRPNIHYHVMYTGSKFETALGLAQTERRPMIIFCGTRARAEEMSRLLVMCYGKEFSRFYHAGLEREEKTEIEKWFFTQKDAVLCSTCAFGMGVDKSDIRTVVHLDAPSTVESYVQEAGRAGRDRSVARAILLWSIEDSLKFGEKEAGDRAAVMKKFAEATTCRRQILLDALDAEQAVCDGCDICDGTTKCTSDIQLAYKFVRTHRKRFSQAEVEGKLVDILNVRAPLHFDNRKLRIWTAESASNLVEQLVGFKIIKKEKFPWNGELSAVSRKQLEKLGIIPQVFRLTRRQVRAEAEEQKRRAFFS